VNSLGQSLEDRLVRWAPTHDVARTQTGLVPETGKRPGEDGDPGEPAGVSASIFTGMTPGQILAWAQTQAGGAPKTAEQIEADVAATRAAAERATAESLEIYARLKGHAEAVAEATRELDAKIKNMLGMTALSAMQIENQRKQAEDALALAVEQFKFTKKQYLDSQPENKEKLQAEIEGLEANNKILDFQLKVLLDRSAAATLTANLGQAEAAREFTLKSEIDVLLQQRNKAKSGVLENITLPLSADEALTGITPTVTQQRVTWTEQDEALLQAKYKALEVYTGVQVPGEGSAQSIFNATSQRIAREAARERAHEERLARANITAEIMMSQSSRQLQVAVANGQMTMEAALTTYEQRNANARTYVQLELDRADIMFKDVASTRAYAANLIASEMDLTKWLLERRVPEEREWLREPGTPVGGVAGQPLDPVRIDPREVAARVTEEMGIGEKTQAAQQAAMRAVVEAEQRLGSAQEGAPPVPTIDMPDQASPAETAAALIPTGAP
jgi:hypothetical protein